MKRTIWLAALLATGSATHAAELSPELVEACRASLPEAMRAAAAVEADQRSGSSPRGSWSIESGQMDGEGSSEAILVILPDGRPGEILFFGEREGKSPRRKKVSIKGKVFTRASVTFQAFATDRNLAHVNAGTSGQVLLHWNGDKLEKVWEVGKLRSGERHWFNLEDLNGDDVSEVVCYYRQELDVFYADEDDLGERGGSDDQSQGQVDAVSVHRYEKGRWKKDKDLLTSLR